MLRKLPITIAFVLASTFAAIAQTTIFSENMGTAPSTTAIASHSFQNLSPIAFSGTADVRNTTASSGYTGASGTGNVFFGTAGGNSKNLVISGINTAAYSNLSLSFGILATSANNILIVEVSSDGVTFNSLTVNSTIAANTWTLKSATGSIPSTTNLRIRFRKDSNVSFRLDDVILTGTLAATPSIIINDNGTQTTVGNVNQGSINVILSQTQAEITTANATLSALNFTSTGTYVPSDIANFKLRYSTDASLDAGDATLSTITTIPATGNAVNFSGLSQTINDGSTGYFFITADIAASAVAGNTIGAGVPTYTFAAGSPTNNATAGGLQTIQAVTPLLSLSSPSPAVAAGTFNQNSTNNVVYRFDMAVTVANTAFTAFDITTTGNYAANGVSNLKAWYSTDATFNAGSDVLLNTIAAPTTAGVQSFSGFNQTLLSGNTHYIFVTVDVSCNAVNGATLGVDAIETTDITTTADKSGSASASGVHTFQEIVPNNASALNAAIANQSLTLSWTNPTGCFNEVMMVAKAGSTIAGSPSGDGSAYTANLNFGDAGSSTFDGGKVIYKGSTSPQTITGLTNGANYFVRIFTRNGESWSAGVEVNATPENIITINFDDAAKWSASPGSYGSHTYTDGAVTFQGTNVLRDGTATIDGFPSAFGTYSFRLRDQPTQLVATIPTGGVGSFSFDIRRWDGAPDPDYTLRYSTNGGSTYTTVATINNASLDNSSNWKTFNGTINSPFDNILIEIARNAGERIMVDNFVYSPKAYETTTWNGSTWNNGTPDASKNAIIDGNLSIATGFTANNLTVNNGAAVTVAAGEIVTVNGAFTNNGSLTLEATNETTYAQLITNGTASGNVTVQRATTGSTAGWRFISPAVSGTLANLGSSVQLTGAANVIRLNTNNPNAWVAQGGVSGDAFEAGRAYVTYFGTDGVIGSNVATTLSLSGALNNSNVTVTGLSDGNSGTTFGWSLAGNPFAAGIDFSNTTEVALTNIDPVYYIWRPEAGNYATWHRTSGSTPSGVLNGVIAPMQGFLVKSNAASPVLTINRAARTSASTGAQFRTANITDRLYVTVRHTGDNRSDEALIAADPSATAQFESDFDALKATSMSTTAYSISTRSADGKQLAINTLPAFDANHSVPVRISGNQPGPMSLSVDLSAVNSTVPIMLEDLHLNRSHDLRTGAYQFAHVPAQSDRFVIHFAPLATSVKANSLDQVQVYTFEGKLYIRGMEQAEQLRIVDMTGRVVYQHAAVQLSAEGLQPQLAAGTYLVQLVGKQGVKTAKVQF